MVIYWTVFTGIAVTHLYQFSEGHWKTEVCPEESHQDGNGTGNHFNQGILKDLGIFSLEKPKNEHNTPKYLLYNHIEMGRDLCSAAS